MKIVLLLLDGLGDRPHSILKGKTPLEYANTPNLDRLCKNAETGIMIPWKQGLPLGTEVAHFILFGYDMKEFPGRGIINALSRDVEIEEKAVYLCTSWAWVEEKDGLFIEERFTEDLSTEEILELMKLLPKSVNNYSFKWQQSIGIHGVLEIKGENISSDISDSDPFYDNSYVMTVEPFESNSSSAIETAEALNIFLKKVYRALNASEINQKRKQNGKQPANFLLTKWAGRKPDLLNFEEKHGLKACIVSSGILMYGIAKLLGMDFIKYNSFSEGVNLALKSDYDFIHLHTKETDEAAHTKDPRNKVKVLEEIDSQIGPLVESALNEDIFLVVTGDHTTPSFGPMIHSGEPVPIMFIGKNTRVDYVDTFGERSCTRGSIRMYGSDLMQMLLNYTDRAQFYNYRQGSKQLNHIPKKINKFCP
ncbi:alkaline phosphatase family protein [Tepidimicrobium xylanilyticum]|uniref:Phosphoglycerate mutase n=1 Tax=Tepidimicrobium xylanilyticum TaxID=1123352 RepID=A0A1H3B5Q4_9FIRM|nr:2,3-bisphosphoglycerate-independent phosphoglycerate mutase [Tepidimicrobium xylanilyticum]GMG96989.1 phosphoglycerate mutase [Tepidimicrobium xylanilyticum]SDX37286.1 phosphoglycerate mutase [Tepidimicrobium xylanilyticum]